MQILAKSARKQWFYILLIFSIPMLIWNPKEIYDRPSQLWTDFETIFMLFCLLAIPISIISIIFIIRTSLIINRKEKEDIEFQKMQQKRRKKEFIEKEDREEQRKQQEKEREKQRKQQEKERREKKEERKQDLIKKYGEDFGTAVFENRLIKGMNEEMMKIVIIAWPILSKLKRLGRQTPPCSTHAALSKVLLSVSGSLVPSPPARVHDDI